MFKLQTSKNIIDPHICNCCWTLCNLTTDCTNTSKPQHFWCLTPTILRVFRDQPSRHFHSLEDFNLFWEYFWPPLQPRFKNLCKKNNCFSDLLVNNISVPLHQTLQRPAHKPIFPLGFFLFLLKRNETINQGLEQIQLFKSDVNHHLISIFCFFFNVRPKWPISIFKNNTCLTKCLILKCKDTYPSPLPPIPTKIPLSTLFTYLPSTNDQKLLA